ncbi:C6 transcription factor [Seiridium cupressi]
MIFALILCLVSTTTAFSLVTPPHPFETLIVDTRVPVLLEDNWVMMSREEHERFLHKRADADSYPTSSEDLTTTTVPIQVSTGTAKATTTTTKAATTTASASALPSPFDNAIAANFTGNAMLPLFNASTGTGTNAGMQGSYSMFNAEKSLVSITQVLDATCAANVTFCTDYLGGVADKLIDSDNCEDDYQEENSVVVQVYQGLKSYQPLYSASCLQDAETSAYCFANAITNSSAIADTYLYYLPLNISYPNSTTPDCNQCTQNVMGIFQAATADRDSGIAYTYAEAAETVNAHCGASYVNATLPEAVASFAVPTQSAPSLLFLSFLVMALSQWLL